MTWTKTTLVLVEVGAGGRTGIGFTYSAGAAARLVSEMLADVVIGQDAMAPGAVHDGMLRQVRNIGRSGLAATAISAVDLALHDLKAKLLDLPLATLLGRLRSDIVIYGSGGFTDYSDDKLAGQLAAWVERDGCRFVKMKVGSDPQRDRTRVRVARAAIGSAAQLFVDANGAHDVPAALAQAENFAESGVTWFEEPVSSDDLNGLHEVRKRMPAGMAVAAGEYGFTSSYFARMLAAGAVDVLQADLTRCGGVTGFLRAAALCEAANIDLSAHCGPAAHLHAACAAPRFRHQEWFHDHARIEHMLFDGAPVPHNGSIAPDLSRPGLGLEFKQKDAERYAN
jgi:L-alanine-DL-glutamate epimerase-like enolase superfamily enzyme